MGGERKPSAVGEVIREVCCSPAPSSSESSSPMANVPSSSSGTWLSGRLPLPVSLESLSLEWVRSPLELDVAFRS